MMKAGEEPEAIVRSTGSNQIRNLSVSSSKRFFAAASEQHCAIIFDSETLQVLLRLPLDDKCECVAWNSNDTLIAAATCGRKEGEDDSIFIFDVEENFTSKENKLILSQQKNNKNSNNPRQYKSEANYQTRKIRHVAFHPIDVKFFASCTKGGAINFFLDNENNNNNSSATTTTDFTQNLIGKIEEQGKKTINSFAFEPEQGKFLVAVGNAGTLMLIDCRVISPENMKKSYSIDASFRIIYSIKTGSGFGSLIDVKFLPTTSSFVSSSSSSQTRTNNDNSDKKEEEESSAVATHLQNTIIPHFLVAADHGITLWKCTTNNNASTKALLNQNIIDPLFFDRCVSVANFSPHSSPVSACHYLTSHDLIVSVGLGDHTVKITDPISKKESMISDSNHFSQIFDLAIIQKERVVLTCGADGTVRARNLISFLNMRWRSRKIVFTIHCHSKCESWRKVFEAFNVRLGVMLFLPLEFY